MELELKINKEWVDEAVQKAVKEIKQNFIPRSVLDDIKSEIKQYNRQLSHYPCDMINIGVILQIIDKYKTIEGVNE